jgi:hypothetical protein
MPRFSKILKHQLGALVAVVGGLLAFLTPIRGLGTLLSSAGVTTLPVNFAVLPLIFRYKRRGTNIALMLQPKVVSTLSVWVGDKFSQRTLG